MYEGTTNRHGSCFCQQAAIIALSCFAYSFQTSHNAHAVSVQAWLASNGFCVSTALLPTACLARPAARRETHARVYDLLTKQRQQTRKQPQTALGSGSIQPNAT